VTFADPRLGDFHERLVIQANTPPLTPVVSVTRLGTVATIVTATPHGFTTGDYVAVAGAVQGYNGRYRATVIDAVTLTVPVSNTLPTPATGAITVQYVSDAQGGRKIGWIDVATIEAEVIPLSAMERVQAQALASQVSYRFRTRSRADITPEMRVSWTPSWPPGGAAQVLEISGVLPDGHGRTFMLLDCGELA
jgi:head-tail adaptor